LPALKMREKIEVLVGGKNGENVKSHRATLGRNNNTGYGGKKKKKKEMKAGVGHRLIGLKEMFPHRLPHQEVPSKG